MCVKSSSGSDVEAVGVCLSLSSKFPTQLVTNSRVINYQSECRSPVTTPFVLLHLSSQYSCSSLLRTLRGADTILKRTVRSTRSNFRFYMPLGSPHLLTRTTDVIFLSVSLFLLHFLRRTTERLGSTSKFYI